MLIAVRLSVLMSGDDGFTIGSSITLPLPPLVGFVVEGFGVAGGLAAYHLSTISSHPIGDVGR